MQILRLEKPLRWKNKFSTFYYHFKVKIKQFTSNKGSIGFKCYKTFFGVIYDYVRNHRQIEEILRLWRKLYQKSFITLSIGQMFRFSSLQDSFPLAKFNELQIWRNDPINIAILLNLKKHVKKSMVFLDTNAKLNRSKTNQKGTT